MAGCPKMHMKINNVTLVHENEKQNHKQWNISKLSENDRRLLQNNERGQKNIPWRTFDVTIMDREILVLETILVKTIYPICNVPPAYKHCFLQTTLAIGLKIGTPAEETFIRNICFPIP